MKLGLINSAWAQSGKGTAYGIHQTKTIGFDTIDIFADPLDADAKERKLIRIECEKAGLPIVSVACHRAVWSRTSGEARSPSEIRSCWSHPT